MRNFFLAIAICAMVLGLGVNVYAFPSMGSDCAKCHGGGSTGGNTGGTTPGCGSSSSGCDRRIGAEAPAATTGMSVPVAGPFATATTQKDGFKVIHPENMDFDLPVMVFDKEAVAAKAEAFAKKFEKMASHGFVVVVPEKGQDKTDCADFMADENDDPRSKFFEKLNLDKIKSFPK